MQENRDDDKLIQSVQFSCSFVSNSATPWTTARQASLSITNSQSLPKFMSIESVVPSNHQEFRLSPSPALNLSEHQGLFKWVSCSHQIAKVLQFQLQHWSFQFKGCCWTTQRHRDPWPPKKNSIRGQRRGLITQSFCVIVILKYTGDRESFWHRHQKGIERVPPC